MNEIMPIERIESRIYLIRGQKVMLDRDLAELYGVPTKALNQAVRRNEKRFPPDFIFQLNTKEKDELVTKCDRFRSLKHSTSLPLAFNEQGIAMLSSVLNSDRAVEVNIMIMRAFVRLRQVLADNKELADKFRELESRVDCHDGALAEIIDRIRELMTPVQTNVIGFELNKGD
ncbi:MAG: ORF6N domain-containing protein [Candidatus Margulisiibacteriota bacterium]